MTTAVRCIGRKGSWSRDTTTYEIFVSNVVKLGHSLSPKESTHVSKPNRDLMAQIVVGCTIWSLTKTRKLLFPRSHKVAFAENVPLTTLEHCARCVTTFCVMHIAFGYIVRSIDDIPIVSCSCCKFLSPFYMLNHNMVVSMSNLIMRGYFFGSAPLLQIRYYTISGQLATVRRHSHARLSEVMEL